MRQAEREAEREGKREREGGRERKGEREGEREGEGEGGREGERERCCATCCTARVLPLTITLESGDVIVNSVSSSDLALIMKLPLHLLFFFSIYTPTEHTHTV